MSTSEPASLPHSADAAYDLLLRGGHVIDPYSGTSTVMDVAIAGERIVEVAWRRSQGLPLSDGQTLRWPEPAGR